jgi:hypothetical protein
MFTFPLFDLPIKTKRNEFLYEISLFVSFNPFSSLRNSLLVVIIKIFLVCFNFNLENRIIKNFDHTFFYILNLNYE